MDQQFTLLNYLLLLPYINNSSKIITTTANIKETPALTTANLIESTFYQNRSDRTLNSSSSSSSSKNINLQRTPSSSTIVATIYLLIMGSCFGSLLAKEPSSSSSSSTPSIACSLWRQQATDEQEAELMAEDEERSGNRKEKLIFRIIKFKRKQKRKQFIEKFWEHQDANYTQLSTRNGNECISDIQLQNLDVNTLLNSSALAKESIINAATASVATSHNVCSRTSSSLDLEWEHEYGSHMRPYTTILPAPPSATASTTHTSHPPATNLNDSWQFLAQRHYFDDEQLNSLSSQHSSSMAAVPPLESEPEPSSAAERDQLQKRTYHTTQQARQIGVTKSMQQQRNISGGGSFTRTSSRTSCSHISTPESLEWDIDEEQQRQMHVEDDNLGLETLELLHQIEQLKNKVLNETGDGLFDERDDFDGFTTTTATNGSGEYREEINIS